MHQKQSTQGTLSISALGVSSSRPPPLPICTRTHREEPFPESWKTFYRCILALQLPGNPSCLVSLLFL